MINVDDKLLKNVLDDLNRLKSQLEDLETYKDDFTPEEIEESKKDTLAQLNETKKRLEKVKSGSLSVKTDYERANEMLTKLIAQNYNVNEVIGIYVNAETNFLREKLSYVQKELELKKISQEEFNNEAITILSLISKKNELNAQEKVLYESLKSKNMSHLQEDKGIDKSKIEKTVSKK